MLLLSNVVLLNLTFCCKGEIQGAKPMVRSDWVSAKNLRFTAFSIVNDSGGRRPSFVNMDRAELTGTVFILIFGPIRSPNLVVRGSLYNLRYRNHWIKNFGMIFYAMMHLIVIPGVKLYLICIWIFMHTPLKLLYFMRFSATLSRFTPTKADSNR